MGPAVGASIETTLRIRSYGSISSIPNICSRASVVCHSNENLPQTIILDSQP